MNILDTRTVLLSSVITSAICAIVMASLWRQNRQRSPELGYWLADFILQFLAVLLIALRGVLPDAVSVLFGVPFSLTGALLMFIGLERYVGKTSAPRYNLILLALFTLVHAYFAFGQPSLPARNINLSLGSLVFCAQCAWLLLRRVDVNMRPETKAVGVVFGIYTLISVLRIFADLVAPHYNDLFTSGLYDTLAILIYQILLIGLVFALFLMVNRHLFTALENDITERKRAEEALRETNDYLENLFNYANAPIIVWNPQFKITRFNHAFETLIGRSAADVLGKSLEILFPPAQIETSMRLIRKTLAGERWQVVEIDIQHVDGSIRTVLWNSATLFSTDGKIPIATIAQGQDITERKRAEHEIANLARFPEENPNPILRVEPGGLILYANAASEPVLAEWHCKVGDWLPLDWLQLVADSVANQSKRIMDAQCGAKVFSFLIAPISEAGYVNLYATDITERKHAEEKLTASEVRYRRLFEAARDGILILDAETGIIVDANPFLIEMLGFSHAEFLGKEIWELGFFKDVFANQAKFAELQQKEYIRYENLPLETSDGRKFNVEFVSNVYQVNHHNLIQCNIRDVTARKRAEAEVRKLNAELEQRVAERTAELSDLYNNAPCGYHSLDGDGVYTQINNTELKWLGYTRDEIIGKIKFPDLLTPASAETFAANFHVFKERSWVQNLEFDMVRKDGSILPVLLNATALTDEAGHFVASRSTVIDHTDRKRAEEAMRESQAKLAGANKELETFAYSVSHDLRAPLRALDGFSVTLLSDYADQLDEQGKHYLNRIQEASRRMGQLIEDLLNLSRITRRELTHQPVDLSALAREIAAELQAREPQRQVEFAIADRISVQGDSHLLRIALENLMSNAWKFTSPRASARIEIGAMEHAGARAVFVRDNGVGFDMAYADKLFAPFQRLQGTQEFPGTGIGLATVQRIIARHGGRIWTEAAENQGATFYFTLGVHNE